MNEKLIEARAVFLMGGLRRYDVLKMVFSEKELSTLTPAVLRRMFIVRLGLQEDMEKVKRDSLYHWLVANGYDKKRKEGKGKENDVQPEKKGFRITDPESLPKKEEPIIKFD